MGDDANGADAGAGVSLPAEPATDEPLPPLPGPHHPKVSRLRRQHVVRRPAEAGPTEAPAQAGGDGKVFCHKERVWCRRCTEQGWCDRQNDPHTTR